MQQLVIDGGGEIVRNYEVDGIHLDDYFYPGLILDATSFARYGGDFEDYRGLAARQCQHADRRT